MNDPINRQKYIYPEDIFSENNNDLPHYWTCLRTKPRWEKKMARWILGNKIPYFLPTIPRTTTSHRKTTTSDIPLIPGYIFVERRCKKADFVETGGVIHTIQPSSHHQLQRLHQDLWQLWKSLQSNSPLELSRKLQSGDKVIIGAGPLKGVEGRFQSWGKNRILHLSIELLGIHVQVKLPDNAVLLFQQTSAHQV